jgi:hypothetical protein
MYIQFQAEAPNKGSYTTNNFEDATKFLRSFAMGSTFSTYKNQKPGLGMSIDQVLKKFKVESLEPINKGQSSYLSFTAKDADDETITYKGMIDF